MGINWMSKGEIAEAIPPAYTEYVGRALIRQLATIAPTDTATTNG